MANNNDNSGLGVALGILLAVIIVVGGYFFIDNNSVDRSGPTINMPDVNTPDTTR
jgi:hypothetical protein